MARLTMKIRGERGINWHVARHVDVQRELKAEADFIKFKAASTLAAHRHDGHSTITSDKGDTDHWVYLDDTRGLNAAAAIEFGRRGYTTADGREVGPAPAIAPLRKAAGLI